jgi:hypothetical protein
VTVCQQYDFALFLSLWNTLQGHTTPRIHFMIANWLQGCWARGEKRLLLLAFRASGKSTIIALFSAWLLCRDPDFRILVLSAEASLSSKMVRNIRKIIERHPLTCSLVPKNPDQWASSQFTVNRNRISRDPSVMARGLTANVTGARADMIICDDVEVPNTCDTPDKREDLRERLAENDFILTPGGAILYIGTPHHWDSIYADEPRREMGREEIFLKDYGRLIVPFLNEEGQSAWPERYGPADVERLQRQAGPARFSAQMMLQPVNILEGRLNPALLRRYEGEPVYSEAQKQIQLTLNGIRMTSCSAWWDPAFGAGSGDSSVLAILYGDEEGDYYLHRIFYLRHDPAISDEEATSQCRQVARIAREFYVPSVTVETNGIGKFLPAILRREMAGEKVPCATVETTARIAKDIRILEGFDAVLAARALHVHGSVYDTPFIREMQEWRPGLKGARDDGLDAVAGALSQSPVRIKRIHNSGRMGWQGGGASHTARTDFDV